MINGVRLAQWGDEEDILVLLRQFHKECELSRIPWNEDKARQLLETYIASNATATERMIIVGIDKGRIVSVLAAFVTDVFFSTAKKAFELVWYSSGNPRLGLRLFAAYLIWAKKVGCSYVGTAQMIGTKHPNLDKFYRRYGFRPTETAYMLEV